MSAPYEGAAVRDRRPAPVILPGGDLAVPGELCAQLCAALEQLEAYINGTPPPAACRSARLSRAALAVMMASRAAAVQHQQLQAQRTSAAPTPTFLPPAQLPRLSDEEMITTRRAADIARVSQEWIRRLWSAGKIRGHKIERDVLMVNLGDVRAYGADRGSRRRADHHDHADAGPEAR